MSSTPWPITACPTAGAEGRHAPNSGCGDVAQTFFASWVVGKQAGPYEASPKPGDLAALTQAIEAGKVMPMIDRTVPLSQFTEAMRYLNEGHARGKVAISLDN